MGVTGYQNSTHDVIENTKYIFGGAHYNDTEEQMLPPQQTLAERALNLREQVNLCHRALDGMNWPGFPEENVKDSVEPGLEQHIQRATAGLTALRARINGLADHVGRL